MLYRLPHYRSWQSLTAQQVALTIGFLTFCLGALDLCRTAIGQTSSDRRDASVVIEGRVEQILEGKSGRIPSDVVQVLIEQATLRRSSDSDAVARYPVPGEYVYIHIASVENESADGSQHVFPEAGQLIRAYLTSAEHGAWQSVSAVWFDLIDSGLDDRASREERGKPTERPTKRGDLVDFGYWGMQGETASVGSRVAVRVMKVHADGPARRAGLEVGDVIVAINGETIDLELLQRPPIGKLQLSVVDVN
ncbi:MAG: PDZ domain-containing protein, partial [Planctomycetota bacterium]|nr:PDZ domain-containing protein [Planctomycetota bacterium]